MSVTKQTTVMISDLAYKHVSCSSC